MKKTFSVNLNQTVFNLDEDAYDSLNNYLSSIKKHFDRSPDAEEIVSDIESRIAEKFSQNLNKNKEVINLKDVQEVEASMGSVADIAGEQAGESSKKIAEEPASRPQKKLYRNPDSKVIAGVASGLASYLNIDTVLIRFFFIITFFIPPIGGASLLVYLVLWVITPLAETSTDKLEMKGEPVTLSRIEDEVSKNSSDSKKKVPQALSRLADVVLSFFSAVLPPLASIIGFLFTLSFALVISGLTFLFVQIIFNGELAGLNLPILTVFATSPYKLFFFSLYFVILLPIIFLLLLSVSLLRRKSSVSALGGMSLIFFWVLSLLFLATSAVNVAPKVMTDFSKYLPSGGFHFSLNETSEIDNSNKRDFALANFRQINASRIRELNIKTGKSFQVLVFGDEESLNNLDAKVKDGTLYLDRIIKPGILYANLNLPVRVEITLPLLTSLNLKGATVASVSLSPQSILKAEVSGASRLTLDADIFNLEIVASGASKIDLTGNTDNLSTNLSGASRILSQNFQTSLATLKASGASNIENIEVRKQLDVFVSGASKVSYSGNPQIKETVSGASRVIRLDGSIN